MKKRCRRACLRAAPGAAAAGSCRNGRSRRFPFPEAGIRSSAPNRPSARSPARCRIRRKPFCDPSAKAPSRRNTIHTRTGTEDRRRSVRRSGRLRPSRRGGNSPSTIHASSRSSGISDAFSAYRQRPFSSSMRFRRNKATLRAIVLSLFISFRYFVDVHVIFSPVPVKRATGQRHGLMDQKSAHVGITLEVEQRDPPDRAAEKPSEAQHDFQISDVSHSRTVRESTFLYTPYGSVLTGWPSLPRPTPGPHGGCRAGRFGCSTGR